MENNVRTLLLMIAIILAIPSQSLQAGEPVTGLLIFSASLPEITTCMPRPDNLIAILSPIRQLMIIIFVLAATASVAQENRSQVGIRQAL